MIGSAVKPSVELMYNEDHSKIAVLLSCDFGSGWGSWNQHAPNIAVDKRIIEFFLAHEGERVDPMVWDDFLNELGYQDVYVGSNVRHLCVVWVDCCRYWRIREYDGKEDIEYLNPDEWNWIPNY